MFTVKLNAQLDGQTTVYNGQIKRTDSEDDTVIERYARSKIKTRAINSLRTDVWAIFKQALISGKTVTVTVD